MTIRCTVMAVREIRLMQESSLLRPAIQTQTRNICVKLP